MLKDWYTEEDAKVLLDRELAMTEKNLPKHLNAAFRKGWQMASDYTPNEHLYPTEIELGNGRIVRIVQRDGRTFLSVLTPREEL